MSEKLRLLLVDDHYLVRVGLSSIIELEADMAVCAEAPSGERALELYRSERPDVVLMDMRLPGMGGAEATEAIRREFPAARVIILSTYCGDEEVYVALQAGAMAYLSKSVLREELVTAIRKAAAGERHVPPELAERLAALSPRSHLSPRELEVMRLIVDGRRNKEIAERLEISEGTVKIHVSNIFQKLQVSDRTEAAKEALQRGIVQLEE
jgi:two-component system NarL family response regulator